MNCDKEANPVDVSEPEIEIKDEEVIAVDQYAMQHADPVEVPQYPSLKELGALIDCLHEKTLTPDVAKEIAQAVESVPYLSKDTKTSMVNHAKAYDLAFMAYSSLLEAHSSDLQLDESATEQTEEPSTIHGKDKEKSNTAEELRALHVLVAKQQALLDKQQALEAKKQALEAKKQALEAKQQALEDTKEAFRQLNGGRRQITKMVECWDKVEKALQQFAIMSQAEQTLLLRSGSRSAAKDEISVHQGTDLAGALTEAHELFDERETLDHTEYLIKDNSKSVHLKLLKRVSDAWGALLVDGTSIPQDYRGANGNIAKIMEQLQETRQMKVSESTPILSEEVTSTQPYCMVLFELICNCCKIFPSSQDYSTSKIAIKERPIVAGANRRPKRIPDACLDKPGRFQLVMLDILLKLCCELKPLFRKKESLVSLHRQSTQQTLGHLAKFVYQGFKLWQIGSSTWAIGLTGTLAYITMIKLNLSMNEYSDAAPEFAKLQVKESVKLPLLVHSQFKKLMEQYKGDQRMFNELEKLRKELYATENEGLDENGIPMGVRIISDLIMSRRQSLFGPDYQTIFGNGSGGRVDKLLGSGSFGLVFSLKEEKNVVLKVSLAKSYVHLNNELQILKILGQQQGQGTTINKELALPVLMEVRRNIPIELGGIKHFLMGLVLSPQGQPIISHIRVTKKDRASVESFLDDISPQLESAIDFLRSKEVVHNDVAPKNVIVHSTDGIDRVCLVDFGCASTRGETIIGFMGTPSYAHPSIFQRYPRREWKSDWTHDAYSLGLTMAALVNKGEPCWDMSSFPVSLTDDRQEDLDMAVKDRHTRASKKIKETNCVEKKKWLNWISPKPWLETFRPNVPEAPAADSLQARPQESETERSQNPPISMVLRSRKRKEMATSDPVPLVTSPK